MTDLRPVTVYVFTGIDAEGMACFDEVIVEACWLKSPWR